jgi:hypothetical protein
MKQYWWLIMIDDTENPNPIGMEFDFDTLHEAQVKVRELKDNDHRSAFIVRLIAVNS